jgi:integrase
MARGFTDIAIRNIKPGSVRHEIPDAGCRGLYLIVQPSGHKAFAVRYRFAGKPKKLSLGSVPLAAARKAATHALHEVTQGRDPSTAKQHHKQERRVTAANTFHVVAEQYLALECGMRRASGKVVFTGPLRTAARRLTDLERLVFPAIGNRPIAEIRRSEIVSLLDKIQVENGPVMADRVLAAIRAIMNWHTSRSDDFRSPIVRGMARTKSKERARSRVLTDAELRVIWTTADKTAPPFGAFVQFLLLTAARRAEAARMTWHEISGTDWTLPAARNKAKVDLVRPLSATAQNVLAKLPRLVDCEFVFTAGSRAFSSFGRAKAAFTASCGVTGWTLHDLRRTARSLMSRAGVNADHAERCLGHVIGGVRGTYDRHEYYDEKRHAFEALAALIRQIADPQDNVISITAAVPRG